jgi:ribosome-binding factor A
LSLIDVFKEASIMANDRRVSRVASMIKREVSQMLVGGAIKDDRVGAGMVSITDVEVSGDLQHAKIFVSIYGSEDAKQETMAGLAAATGYVRREIGARVRLRRTPEVMFFEDRSLERGVKMIDLLERISKERQASEATQVPPEDSTDVDLEADLEDLDAELEAALDNAPNAMDTP